jgi:hypothetical protein
MTRRLKLLYVQLFRFNYLWQNVNSKSNDKNKFYVLFAWRISIEQSLGMLSKIELINNNKNFSGLNILIKKHPTPPSILINNFLKENKIRNYTIVDDSTDKILNKIQFLVGGMSSITLEAICLGKKVIIISNENSLNYYTIPKDIDKSLYTICYSDEDFIFQLNEYIYNNTQIIDHKENEIIKKKYFENINYNSLDNFIK